MACLSAVAALYHDTTKEATDNVHGNESCVLGDLYRVKLKFDCHVLSTFLTIVLSLFASLIHV